MKPNKIDLIIKALSVLTRDEDLTEREELRKMLVTELEMMRN